MSQDAFYTFMPWLRQGLASGITTADDHGAGSTSMGDRVSLQIKLDMAKTPAGSTSPGTPTLIPGLPQALLLGPGDVTGINPNMVIKISPAEGIQSFEPDLFPFIEFYDEEFPWRYTPVAPAIPSTAPSPDSSQPANRNNQIRPWLALLALEEDEFEERDFNGICPHIKIKKTAPKTWVDILPDEKRTWAWAHIQVNDNLGNNDPANDTMTATKLDTALNHSTTGLNKLLGTNPDKAFSRILCARRLKANTRYFMFLVPNFEIGRLAGLDLPTLNVNASLPAWTLGNTTTSDLDMPYYYRWSFVTGAGTNFEELVERLKPYSLDSDLGKRPIDVQLPGGPLNQTNDPLYPEVMLEGVLSPILNPPFNPTPWPIGDSGSEYLFTSVLRDFLNEQDKNLQVPITQQNNSLAYYSDPVITAPTYGKWHIMKRQLDVPNPTLSPKWIDTVNLDPRARIYAGLGADMFREFQEHYMDLAWRQIDDIVAANIIINNTRAMLEAMWRAFHKDIETSDADDVASYVVPLHSQISHSSANVFKTVADSVVPSGCYTGVFNRINRPAGPFARAVAQSTNSAPVAAYEVAAAFNTGAVTATPNLNNPAGLTVMDSSFTSTQTSSYTNNLTPVSNFVISDPGSSFSPQTGSMFSTQGSSLQSAMANFHQDSSAPVNNYTPSTQPALDYDDIKNEVVDQLNPQSSYPSYVKNSKVVKKPHNNDPPPSLFYDHLLAAPEMPEPMFRKLADRSLDWIMPGLGEIPDESISLMQVNQNMIEAFMLGLNFEMNRELLWREYPTDLRGTFFRQFWNSANTPTPDAESQKDIKPIHQWKNSAGTDWSLLGENSPRTGDPSGLLVLCVRGELLRKFPNTLVYAHKAKWATTDYKQPRVLDTSSSANLIWPTFSATLKPDTYFIGFALNKDVARGTGFVFETNPDDPDADDPLDPNDPGYYFVFEERLGETRFGLDAYKNPINSPASIDSWDKLEWGHFINTNTYHGYLPVSNAQVFNVTQGGNPQLVDWASNSADMAYTLTQRPVRICVHARDMIQQV